MKQSNPWPVGSEYYNRTEIENLLQQLRESKEREATLRKSLYVVSALGLNDNKTLVETTLECHRLETELDAANNALAIAPHDSECVKNNSPVCTCWKSKLDPSTYTAALAERDRAMREEARNAIAAQLEQDSRDLQQAAMARVQPGPQAEGPTQMTASELFALVAASYHDKPDDYMLSLGHHELPDAARPLGMWNLPEFCAFVSITMREVREWAKP